MIINDVITTKEIASLKKWAASVEDQLIANTIGEGRFSGQLSALGDIPVKNLKVKVKKAIGTSFGALIDTDQDFLSINKPGSHINSHIDPQMDGQDVIRGLLMVQSPDVGGVIQYNSEDNVVPEGSVWVENISTTEHGSTEISGDKDRYFIAFNFKVESQA